MPASRARDPAAGCRTRTHPRPVAHDVVQLEVRGVPAVTESGDAIGGSIDAFHQSVDRHAVIAWNSFDPVEAGPRAQRDAYLAHIAQSGRRRLVHHGAGLAALMDSDGYADPADPLPVSDPQGGGTAWSCVPDRARASCGVDLEPRSSSAATQYRDFDLRQLAAGPPRTLLVVLLVCCALAFAIGGLASWRPDMVREISGTAFPGASPGSPPRSHGAPAPAAPAKAQSPNLDEVEILIRNAGLPLGATTLYTEVTDDERLLGQPRQYVAKLYWQDTRLRAPTDPGRIQVRDGGGVEVFAVKQDRDARQHSIEARNRQAGLPEYDFALGQFLLLRVSGLLSPEQAQAYQAALLPLD